jgi:hypothetical protein
MIRLLLIFSLLLGFASTAYAGEFDHASWNNLLQAHVKTVDGGKATEVDYRGLQVERPMLQAYLKALSSVDEKVFNVWDTSDQLAFLINAYNAWTVELILTRYPDLESIKDLGSFLQSPWKKKFIPLLGKTRSLDDIEHGLIRESGRYNDPRIHFAVNCASVGCPALRAEAYRGDIIEQQLQEAETSFLSDRSRNRVSNGVFEISSIFKWYGDDFRKGWLGVDSLEQYLLSHSEKMGATINNGDKIGKSKLKMRFLKYDWKLNDFLQSR